MSMRVIRCVYIVIRPWLHIEMCDFLESLEGVYVCVCVTRRNILLQLSLSVTAVTSCLYPPTHTHTQFYFNLTNLSSHKNGGMFGALALSVHTCDFSKCLANNDKHKLDSSVSFLSLLDSLVAEGILAIFR